MVAEDRGGDVVAAGRYDRVGATNGDGDAAVEATEAGCVDGADSYAGLDDVTQEVHSRLMAYTRHLEIIC